MSIANQKKKQNISKSIDTARFAAMVSGVRSTNMSESNHTGVGIRRTTHAKISMIAEYRRWSIAETVDAVCDAYIAANGIGPDQPQPVVEPLTVADDGGRVDE